MDWFYLKVEKCTQQRMWMNTVFFSFRDGASESDTKKSGSGEEADDDDDNYEDADDDVEDDAGAIEKQLMQNGLQSPDSGIHGDKSANELTLSA